ALCSWIAFLGEARAAGRLNEYLGKAEPAELVPGADRLGPPQGDPSIAPAYKGDRLLGYVYLNSDFANAVGYSGKPIQVLVGIDPKGVLTGLKLVEHKEPIVLVGIPEKRILEAVTKLIGSERLGGQGSQAAAAPPRVAKAIDTGKSEVRDWQSLIGDGSVRRLTLSVADVNQAFEKSANAAAAARPEEGAADDTFIDLYLADVAVPS